MARHAQQDEGGGARRHASTEAARAHDRAALARDPEFVKLNFPRADYEPLPTPPKAEADHGTR